MVPSHCLGLLQLPMTLLADGGAFRKLSKVRQSREGTEWPWLTELYVVYDGVAVVARIPGSVLRSLFPQYSYPKDLLGNLRGTCAHLPACKRQRQKDYCKSEASLGYTVTFCLKTKTKTTQIPKQNSPKPPNNTTQPQTQTKPKLLDKGLGLGST